MDDGAQADHVQRMARDDGDGARHAETRALFRFEERVIGDGARVRIEIDAPIERYARESVVAGERADGVLQEARHEAAIEAEHSVDRAHVSDVGKDVWEAGDGAA